MSLTFNRFSASILLLYISHSTSIVIFLKYMWDYSKAQLKSLATAKPEFLSKVFSIVLDPAPDSFSCSLALSSVAQSIPQLGFSSITCRQRPRLFPRGRCSSLSPVHQNSVSSKCSFKYCFIHEALLVLPQSKLIISWP